MLFDEQGRRGNEGHLFLILNRFEGCSHRNFGFPKPHISRDQAIHRNGALHIRFHLIDGGELVGGFHKRKSLLELALPRRIGREGESRCCHASRIELDQVHRELAHRFTCFALGGSPIRAPHFGQCRGITSHVVAQLI